MKDLCIVICWIALRWGRETLSLTFNRLIITLTLYSSNIFIPGKFLLMFLFLFWLFFHYDFVCRLRLNTSCKCLLFLSRVEFFFQAYDITSLEMNIHSFFFFCYHILKKRKVRRTRDQTYRYRYIFSFTHYLLFNE